MIFLRFVFAGLKTVRARMPAARYGQRVADAQQIILVKGLCEQLRPRPEEGDEGN